MGEFTVVSRGMFSRSVTIDELGVRRGRRLIAWSDVEHYRYDWQDWSRPGDFLLISRGGQMLRIAPIFDHWQIVAERLLGELHPRLINEGLYHPFALEADALVHRGMGQLPYADILHVEIASVGASVIVLVEARTGEWAKLDIVDIANPWLWLDQLAKRNIAMVSTLPLHLPPVLSELTTWSAGDHGLPKATMLRPRRT
jgi:hypothetical protein